ncbi:DUF4105 domain-containing protein [Gammaproteobacteria bacterium]|nr:DUF4105 domain-containing protein [Gammaproteobacteria bacterium]
MFLKYILLPVLASLLASTSAAATGNSSYIRQLVQRADDSKLWQHREWLNLGHYRQSKIFTSSYSSAVDDKRFFYSGNGETSPRAELNATLAALFSEQPTGNEHALCRSPARYDWLKQHLQIDATRLPKPVCSDYIEWRSHIHAESVTLVFPTYQLNSPSSMFGHTLLRLDPADDENWSDWLSYAVNFGANISKDDNSLFYAWKGLTGGYPGQFIVMPYYEKIKEYNRIEKRDIWEYRLNLQPAEVELLVTHLWELKDINFAYYFFTENCSYRLLELIEVARPGIELTDEFVITAIPADTIRSVEDAGLVESTSFRPSQETVTKQMIADLPEDDYTLLEAFLEQPLDSQTAEFLSLDEARQQALLATSYKMLRLRQNRKPRDPETASKSHQLLEQLSHYPQAPDPVITPPVRPETGHLSKQLTLGALERDGHGYSELGMRMSYHDLEDNEAGYMRGAQINIIGMVLRRRNSTGTVFLQSANFADVFSLTPRSRFFTPISWRVRGGVERVYSDDKDRLVGHVSGGGGYAWPLLEDGTVYSLLTGRLEANSTFTHKLEPALGAAAGGLYHSTIGTGRTEINAEKFTGGEYRINFSLTQNLLLSRNNALQIKFKREWHNNKDFNEVGLSYNFFF